jgi:hypothetical protein
VDADIVLDDVLKAIEIIRPFFPLGTPAAIALAVAYETVVELRAIRTQINPEDLRATLANRLGADVAGILGERFGHG